MDVKLQAKSGDAIGIAAPGVALDAHAKAGAVAVVIGSAPTLTRLPSQSRYVHQASPSDLAAAEPARRRTFP